MQQEVMCRRQHTCLGIAERLEERVEILDLLLEIGFARSAKVHDLTNNDLGCLCFPSSGLATEGEGTITYAM
jgi:hypothetical protein